MKESKTIEVFKKDLIKILPYTPNTKEVKEELTRQCLVEVMLHYLHWASRLIPIRPRKVNFEPFLLEDIRWNEYESDVHALLKKVKLGGDLNEHLSNKVLTKGYTPKDYILSKNDIWTDKDELLNTKGFHHLHLHAGKSNKGNIILLAQVNRDNFTAVALFDHSVFDFSKNEMSKERQRMWDIHNQIMYRELPPDSVYVSNPITMSGHPVHIITMTQNYWYVVSQIDDKIENQEFIKDLFISSNIQLPKKPKLKWLLYGLDLGLLETKSNTFFAYRKGYL